MHPLLVVTGGIGSGKSFVTKMFSAIGVPIYDADTRTKELYGRNRMLLNSLKTLLGEDLVKDGVLDKVYMAKKIFVSPSLLKNVEDIVFPFVKEDIAHWRKSNERADSPFLIMESAIYLEKEALRGLADRVLTISCPEEVRIQRAMKRNNVSRKSVVDRLKNQRSDAYRESMSDYVIISDFEHPLLPQVINVYNLMKEV